jgi:hypothetical protein
MNKLDEDGRYPAPVASSSAAASLLPPPPPPPPPRATRCIGDHSYLPDAHTIVANIHLVASNNVVLLADAARLVSECGMFASAVDLLSHASAAAPVVLSHPFSSFSEDDTICFLRAI